MKSAELFVYEPIAFWRMLSYELWLINERGYTTDKDLNGFCEGAD